MTTFRITPVTGPPRTVRDRMADRLAWEAYAVRHKPPLPINPTVRGAGTDSQDVDLATFAMNTYSAFLAWQADTRDTQPRPPMATWLADIDDITPLEDPEPDPTHAAAGTD